jgi:hypothetical protein
MDDDEADLHQLYHMIELMEDERDDEDEVRRHRIAVLGAVIFSGAEESRRERLARRQARRIYLIRGDLLPNPRSNTPWQALYLARNDRAFVTTMGVDVSTFNHLLSAGFTTIWNTTPIPRDDIPTTAVPRAHRRSLDSAGALGLVLHWLNSTMREVSLMQIFALIPSTVSRYLNFALAILLRTLKHIPEGIIQWPAGDKFQELNYLVTARHPLLTGAFGTLDGLNLPVQTSSDQEIENATYNGWLHDHFVSSVIAFAADGQYESDLPCCYQLVPTH